MLRAALADFASLTMESGESLLYEEWRFIDAFDIEGTSAASVACGSRVATRGGLPAKFIRNGIRYAGKNDSRIYFPYVQKWLS